MKMAHTILRYGLAIVLSLFLLVINFITMQDSSISRDDVNDLRCCIAITSKITSLSSRGVGFSYELLNYYADDNNKAISFTPFSSEAVWDSLSRGDIDMIVFDYDDIEPDNKYLKNAIVSVPLRGRICVAINKKENNLVTGFNFWLSTFKDTRSYVLITNRYFRSYQTTSISNTKSRELSPYQDIIKKYSKFSGLDWVLVSALAYQESRYYMGAQSGTAHGIMQIKPSTASLYGVDDVYTPELNIKAGTLHMQYLIRLYSDEGLDSQNVIKFALAAYNAGEGRIAQCRSHAAETGYNSDDWDQVAASLATHPTFVGTQTIKYVDDILSRYEDFQSLLQ